MFSLKSRREEDGASIFLYISIKSNSFFFIFENIFLNTYLSNLNLNLNNKSFNYINVNNYMQSFSDQYLYYTKCNLFQHKKTITMILLIKIFNTCKEFGNKHYYYIIIIIIIKGGGGEKFFF